MAERDDIRAWEQEATGALRSLPAAMHPHLLVDLLSSKVAGLWIDLPLEVKQGYAEWVWAQVDRACGLSEDLAPSLGQARAARWDPVTHQVLVSVPLHPPLREERFALTSTMAWDNVTRALLTQGLIQTRHLPFLMGPPSERGRTATDAGGLEWFPALRSLSPEGLPYREVMEYKAVMYPEAFRLDSTLSRTWIQTFWEAGMIWSASYGMPSHRTLKRYAPYPLEALAHPDDVRRAAIGTDFSFPEVHAVLSLLPGMDPASEEASWEALWGLGNICVKVSMGGNFWLASWHRRSSWGAPATPFLQHSGRVLGRWRNRL